MRKKILIVLGVLAAIVVVFLGIVAMQPDDFRVERSAKVKAPASVLFAQVNDFHNWEAWSPWAKLDPKAVNKFEGPSAGEGARFSWSGNDDVGAGRMEITKSNPDELILIKLDFERPMESTCNTEFKFKEDGDETTVTWTMSGKNDFIGKAFCMFMNMDKMVGGDFEKGLAQMKAVAEKSE